MKGQVKGEKIVSHRESHTENVTFKVFCLHNKNIGDFSMEKNCRSVFSSGCCHQQKGDFSLGLSEKSDIMFILLVNSAL